MQVLVVTIEGMGLYKKPLPSRANAFDRQNPEFPSDCYSFDFGAKKMTIRTRCPKCSKTFKVEEEHVGRKTRCSACETSFVIAAELETPQTLPVNPLNFDFEPKQAVVDKSTTSANGSGRSAIAGMIGGIALTVIVGYVVFLFTQAKPTTANQEPLKHGFDSANSDSPPSKEISEITPTAPVKPEAPLAIEEAKQRLASPTEIVFPAPRTFHHDLPVRNSQADGTTYFRCLLKTADGKVFFPVSFLGDTKSGTISTKGSFEFFVYSTDWDRSKQPEVKVRADNHTFSLESYRSISKAEDTDGKKHFVEALFTLEQYAAILSAKRVTINVDNIAFELDDDHLEAMRELASQLPDGKTTNGKFVIKHVTDSDSVKPIGSTKRTASLIDEAIATGVNELKANLFFKIKQIASAKDELKRAKIADDKEAIENANDVVAGYQTELRILINQPFKAFEEASLSIGQIRHVRTNSFAVIDLINEAKGEVVVRLDTDVAKLVGVQSDTLMTNYKRRRDGGGSELRDVDYHEIFVVVRRTTFTYKQQFVDRPIYELHACGPIEPFSEDELKTAREAANPKFELSFTDEEQARMQSTIDKNNADLKSRRSKSYLESGKLLLKKDNRSGARKQLEKAVAEDPDSEVGKEAAKLLESLP